MLWLVPVVILPPAPTSSNNSAVPPVPLVLATGTNSIVFAASE